MKDWKESNMNLMKEAIETLKKIKDSIIDSSIELINNDMKINNLYTVSNDIIHFY